MAGKTASSKQIKEALRELYDHLGGVKPGYEAQAMVANILRDMGEEDGLPETSIEDPVLESHLTDTQIKRVREAKKSGTFAGPESNP